MKPLSHARDDIFGGLVSAAIAIPLAMGYGMFAFSSLGENYFADGALAGLVTASIVPIVCVLLGDKTTTVYAPRVTSTFFIGLLIFGLVRFQAVEAMATGEHSVHLSDCLLGLVARRRAGRRCSASSSSGP